MKTSFHSFHPQKPNKSKVTICSWFVWHNYLASNNWIPTALSIVIWCNVCNWYTSLHKSFRASNAILPGFSNRLVFGEQQKNISSNTNTIVIVVIIIKFNRCSEPINGEVSVEFGHINIFRMHLFNDTSGNVNISHNLFVCWWTVRILFGSLLDDCW